MCNRIKHHRRLNVIYLRHQQTHAQQQSASNISRTHTYIHTLCCINYFIYDVQYTVDATDTMIRLKRHSINNILRRDSDIRCTPFVSSRSHRKPTKYMTRSRATRSTFTTVLLLYTLTTFTWWNAYHLGFLEHSILKLVESQKLLKNHLQTSYL